MPSYVHDWVAYKAEAIANAEDITAKPFEGTYMTFPESFTMDEEDKGKESDSSSSNSSLDDPEAGLEHEGHLHDVLVAARTTIVAHGKAPTSLVHMVSPDDDSSTPLIKLVCSSRSNRTSSIMETAEQLKLGARNPCAKCKKQWPDYMTGFWD